MFREVCAFHFRSRFPGAEYALLFQVIPACNASILDLLATTIFTESEAEEYEAIYELDSALSWINRLARKSGWLWAVSARTKLAVRKRA